MSFEESRLILNFMLNNFDHLFRLNKNLEESINRRRMLMEKYGYEEALLGKKDKNDSILTLKQS